MSGEEEIIIIGGGNKQVARYVGKKATIVGLRELADKLEAEQAEGDAESAG